jgi:uncharacterized protein YkwD
MDLRRTVLGWSAAVLASASFGMIVSSNLEPTHFPPPVAVPEAKVKTPSVDFNWEQEIASAIRRAEIAAAASSSAPPAPAPQTDTPAPSVAAPAPPSPRPAPAPAPKPAPAPAPAGDYNPNTLVGATNIARRDQGGCGPVIATFQGNALAQSYAQELADTGHWSHYGVDGRSPDRRMRDAGISFSYMGENLQYGSDSAQAAVADLLTSPPHRANMLDCAHRYFGGGHAVSAGGRPYWVQEFWR